MRLKTDVLCIGGLHLAHKKSGLSLNRKLPVFKKLNYWKTSSCQNFKNERITGTCIYLLVEKVSLNDVYYDIGLWRNITKINRVLYSLLPTSTFSSRPQVQAFSNYGSDQLFLTKVKLTWTFDLRTSTSIGVFYYSVLTFIWSFRTTGSSVL